MQLNIWKYKKKTEFFLFNWKAMMINFHYIPNFPYQQTVNRNLDILTFLFVFMNLYFVLSFCCRRRDFFNFI